MKKYLYSIFFLLIFSTSVAYSADIPMMMNYQGSVEVSGVPYNGNGYFKFAIVNLAGDTTYWSNDGTSSGGAEPTDAVTIAVTNGLFTVKLGDTSLTNMNALSASIFDTTNVYLSVWFSDDNSTFEQLSPDRQIVSAGFAFKAADANTVGGKTASELQGAGNTVVFDSGAIGSGEIFSGTSTLELLKQVGTYPKQSSTSTLFVIYNDSLQVDSSGDTCTLQIRIDGTAPDGSTYAAPIFTTKLTTQAFFSTTGIFSNITAGTRNVEIYKRILGTGTCTRNSGNWGPTIIIMEIEP